MDVPSSQHSLELEKAQAMSQAEVNRAQIGASVARLARNVAALSAIFAQSNLEFAEAKTLNAEFWYQTSLRLADIASGYLERAIGISFLAEHAFEFTENRRLDVIRFDYSQSEGVLSADALLADLDAIEYERINGRLNKVMPVKQVIRLREKDFFGFAELKRTGSIAFETPLFDFDLSHPGSFQQHIASVEVEVLALVPPEGIRGTLRKAGLSYLRYRVGAAGTGATPPNTAADWIEYTPTNFRVAPVIQSNETLILSPFDVRRDGVVLRPDPGEQLRVFEGSGVGTTWTLSLRPCSNDFDFSTITDVNLIVYYYSQYDDGLERAVNLERGKLLALGAMMMQQTRGFSLRELFPDEMYYLQNPLFDSGEDSWQQRTLHLDIIPGLFAPNQINRRLQGITLVFIGVNDYLDVHASLSTTGFNVPPAAFQAAEVDPRIRAALGQNQPPEATWNLTIRAAENVGPWTLPGLYRSDGSGKVALDASGNPIPDPAGVAVFDPVKVTQIKDIWLIFNYQFDLAGECGEPIIFWDHFWNSATASFATNGNVNSTAWFADNLNGTGAWSLAQGRMTQTVAGVQSIITPVTSFDWRNVAITAQVNLPTVVGDSVGLAFRYTPPSGGQPSGDYYLARLTQVNGSKLEIALDMRYGGVVSTLQSVQSGALATMMNFELAVRARNDQLEVYVDGRLVLRGTDGTINSGAVGLYASGAGIGFSEVLVSDLTGR